MTEGSQINTVFCSKYTLKSHFSAQMLHKFIKYGVNMAYSELIGVNIPAEIDYLVKNDSTLDERLVHLLKEVATANESIDLVNLFVLRYIHEEVSQLDLRIALNKYKVSNQSVVD